SAHPEIRGERRPTVRRVGGPYLGIVVWHSVGVTWPARAEIVTAVVPGDRHIPAGLVDGDGRHELAVDRVIAVQPNCRGPRGSVVVGVLEHDVGVVAFVRRLLGPDGIHPA